MKKFSCLFYAFALVLCLGACGQNAQGKWQEQYDLGVRYLAEGNYEEAIIAFTAAIEIDPERPEAYADLARTYVAVGEPEQAVHIMEQATEAVGESEILNSVWEDLGLDPFREAEQMPSGSLNEMSFADMSIEEIMNVLPALVQDEIIRSEQGELMVINELTAYSQFKEYDCEDRIVRETGYNTDGTVYYVENR